MPALLLSIGGLMALGGTGIKLAGDGLDEASHGIVKIVVAGGIAYFVLKKTKVL